MRIQDAHSQESRVHGARSQYKHWENIHDTSFRPDLDVKQPSHDGGCCAANAGSSTTTGPTHCKRAWASLQVLVQVPIGLLLELQQVPRVVQAAFIRLSGHLDGHQCAVPLCRKDSAGSARAQALACSHRTARDFTTWGVNPPSGAVLGDSATGAVLQHRTAACAHVGAGWTGSCKGIARCQCLRPLVQTTACGKVP